MNIQIEAAKNELARVITEVRESAEREAEYRGKRLDDNIKGIEAKCLAAIEAAEELCKLSGLDVLEHGIAYRGFVEIREDSERYGATRDTKGHLKIDGIPKGKYRAVVLLIPDTG